MNAVLSAATNLLVMLSEEMRPHLSKIAVAIALTMLAIWGNDINRRVKRLVNNWPFIVRVLVFVLLVAFGYGAASLAISHFLGNFLMLLDSRFLGIFVISIFVLIGVLAEHKGHI